MANGIKQLILSNGDEIICEILDEDEVDIVIRNAVKIAESYDDYGNNGYVFKAFMLFQDGPDNIMLLRSDKIIAAANPIAGLTSQYVGMIKSAQLSAASRTEDAYKEVTNLDSDKSNVIPFITH